MTRIERSNDKCQRQKRSLPEVPSIQGCGEWCRHGHIIERMDAGGLQFQVVAICLDEENAKLIFDALIDV